MHVFLSLVKTRSKPVGDYDSVAGLVPMSSARVVHMDPGKITMWLDQSYHTRTEGSQVMFGVAEGESMYLLGTRFLRNDNEYKSHQVSLIRDGGSLLTMVGVPTQPGENTTRFFAIVGDDILTDAMKKNTKKFMKLTMPQVHHLFKQKKSALNILSPHYARTMAMRTVRRVWSKHK